MKIVIPHQVTDFLVRFKPVVRQLFFAAVTIILLGLVYVVYQVNQVLAMPTDETYRLEQLQTTIGKKFNAQTEETIDRIEQLQTSSNIGGENLILPESRVNPFAE